MGGGVAAGVRRAWRQIDDAVMGSGQDRGAPALPARPTTGSE